MISFVAAVSRAGGDMPTATMFADTVTVPRDSGGPAPR